MNYFKRQWDDMNHIIATTSNSGVKTMLQCLRISTIVFPILAVIMFGFNVFMVAVKHVAITPMIIMGFIIPPALLIILVVLFVLLGRGD